MECKRLFCLFAKSVTEKNNRMVDRVEATKKTVQDQRNEGLGIFGGWWLTCGAARNELSGEA